MVISDRELDAIAGFLAMIWKRSVRLRAFLNVAPDASSTIRRCRYRTLHTLQTPFSIPDRLENVCYGFPTVTRR